MKILVTGANGYLGQGVVKALLDNGHSVVAADFKTNYVDDRAEKMDCDLFSVEDPYTYFGKPDVLLHLAWRDGFVHYSENHIADLPKHYHFLKQMVDAGIAINDNYDSNNYKGTTLGMDVVVSNLVNTMYCRDAGKKLRTANQVKWRKGITTASAAPFGYQLLHGFPP